MATKKANQKVSKIKPVKRTDEEEVTHFMKRLQHPLKAEIEELRRIIKDSSTKIAERIKWNAPSYYYKEDMVTFNPRASQHVHLVFHHPAIEKIKSNMLQGDYKGRRMAYFGDMKEVRSNEKELTRVMNELIVAIENK